MEEFWQDITLSPSHQPISAAVTDTMILQEFLALPRAQSTVISSSPPQQDGPPPPPPQLHSVNRKRGPESVDGNSAGDRKYERLMRNRESAARSRAKKQAYTYELEKKLAYLKQENAKLKRQEEELIVEGPAMPSEKNKLYRTLTAPF